jgi:hypothetical protein
MMKWFNVVVNLYLKSEIHCLMIGLVQLLHEKFISIPFIIINSF